MKDIQGAVTLVSTSGGVLRLGEGSLRVLYRQHIPRIASVYIQDTGELPPPERLRGFDLAFALLSNDEFEYKVIFKVFRWIHSFGSTYPESLRGNISSMTVTDRSRKREEATDSITEVSFAVPTVLALTYQLGWFRYQALEKLLDIDRLTNAFSHLSDFGPYPFRYSPVVLAVDENNLSESFDLVLRHCFTFHLQNAPATDDAILSTEHIMSMLLEIMGFLDNQEYSFESVSVTDPHGIIYTVHKPGMDRPAIRTAPIRENHDLASYFQTVSSIGAVLFQKSASDRLKTLVAMRRLVRATEHEEIPVRAMYYHAALSYLLEVLDPTLAGAPYAKRSLARSYHDGSFGDTINERKTLSDFDRYRSQLLQNGFLFDGDQDKTTHLVQDVVPIISKVFARVCSLNDDASHLVAEFLTSNYAPIPFDVNTPLT